MKKTLLTSAVLMALTSSAFAADYTFKTEDELQKQLANITQEDNVTINRTGVAAGNYYGAAMHDTILNANNVTITSTNKAFFPHMNGHHVVINAEGNVNVESGFWAGVHMVNGDSYTESRSLAIDAKGDVSFNSTVVNFSELGTISLKSGGDLTISAEYQALRNDGRYLDFASLADLKNTSVTAQAKNMYLTSETDYALMANMGKLTVDAADTLVVTQSEGDTAIYAGSKKVSDGTSVGLIDVKANTGIINGKVLASGGGHINIDFNSEDSVINGQMQKNGSSVLNVKMNGGTWNAAGYSMISNLEGNATINVANNATVEADVVKATATINLLTDAETLKAGRVTVAEATGSDFTVNLSGVTAEDVTQEQAVALIGRVTAEGAKITGFVAEGDVLGSLTVGENGVQQAVNAKTEALADKVSLAPNMITRIMMNDVRKRMGDLRAAEGTHGVWARYNGGQMSATGVDADFSMVQVGIDTVPVVDAPRFGVAFSYAETEAKDNLGTTDMDSFSLAFYGTKMYENGMFVDVIGRMATMDSDIVNAGAKGKMDNVALSLSGELGWRFDVTDRFFFEPSMEATYTYTNADTFTMSNGGTYELEATDSLVGRAGFVAGFKCPANKGDVYVRAAVVHEFMGDMTVNSSINGVAAASLEADGKDTWFEYAIGAQFNVNKNTYVYADIERTEGATMDEDWRANVGVRFAF